MKKIFVMIALFTAGAVSAQDTIISISNIDSYDKKNITNFAMNPIESKEFILWLKGDTTLQTDWNITPNEFVKAFAGLMQTGPYSNRKFENADDVVKFIKRKTKIVEYEPTEDAYIISQFDTMYRHTHYIMDRIDPGNILFFKTTGGYYVPLLSLQTGNLIH